MVWTRSGRGVSSVSWTSRWACLVVVLPVVGDWLEVGDIFATCSGLAFHVHGVCPGVGQFMSHKMSIDSFDCIDSAWGLVAFARLDASLTPIFIYMVDAPFFWSRQQSSRSLLQG